MILRLIHRIDGSMTKKIFVISLVTGFFFPFITDVCYATTVQRLALEDLVKKAHRIVIGKVSSSRTYWSADRKLILTNYSIRVDENMKGRPAAIIELTTVGGKIGDVALYVSGMPSFQTGEDAVVFVEQSGAYQTVVGLGQGKFTVSNGEVSNNVSDLTFPDRRPGNPLKMPLQNFKTQIRTILSR
jgi:hypothetical protein